LIQYEAFLKTQAGPFPVFGGGPALYLGEKRKHSAVGMKIFFIFRAESIFISIFAPKSQRNRISLTYLDIILHDMHTLRHHYC